MIKGEKKRSTGVSNNGLGYIQHRFQIVVQRLTNTLATAVTDICVSRNYTVRGAIGSEFSLLFINIISNTVSG